jgi:uncharacterized hydrophobic protein (TIGR00271 family)
MANSKTFALTQEQRKLTIEQLLDVSLFTPEYVMLLILSSLIVIAGLLIDSASAIIGGMVVAPLLPPILAMSMGFALADLRLLRKSMKTLLVSIAVAVALAAVLTLFAKPNGMTGEILERSSASLAHFMIAVCAGVLAAYSHAKPNVSSALTGIAVSVALLPPIAVTGIGIAALDWNLVSGSLLLFILNLIGIIFPATMIFSVMGFYPMRRHARQTLNKEEKEAAEEWKDLDKKSKE